MKPGLSPSEAIKALNDLTERYPSVKNFMVQAQEARRLQEVIRDLIKRDNILEMEHDGKLVKYRVTAVYFHNGYDAEIHVEPYEDTITS